MLFYIALILFILWLIGAFVFTVTKLIHVLIVVAIVLVIWRLIRGR
jgi:hypothetical protein